MNCARIHEQEYYVAPDAPTLYESIRIGRKVVFKDDKEWPASFKYWVPVNIEAHTCQKK